MQKGLYGVTIESVSSGRDNISQIKEMLIAEMKVLEFCYENKIKLEKLQAM